MLGGVSGEEAVEGFEAFGKTGNVGARRGSSATFTVIFILIFTLVDRQAHALGAAHGAVGRGARGGGSGWVRAAS